MGVVDGASVTPGDSGGIEYPGTVLPEGFVLAEKTRSFSAPLLSSKRTHAKSPKVADPSDVTKLNQNDTGLPASAAKTVERITV
jgi:hypothetical protein